jgi:predicted GIY-YIG superfamily endonuclease
MFYVYILISQKDQSKYVGVTEDLKKRVKEHNSKQSVYSSTKAPYSLVWYCAFKEKERQ